MSNSSATSRGTARTIWRCAARMPQVFRSATSPDLAGKTRFLALKGADTLFPGNKKLSFKHVTDGTSNTLQFVEAAPEAAVEWTKPADIEFDATRPFAGLESPRGAFLAALCDGSVHRISLAISKATMAALATRDGGEAPNPEWQSLPPGPHDYSLDAAEVNATKQ